MSRLSQSVFSKVLSLSVFSSSFLFIKQKGIDNTPNTAPSSFCKRELPTLFYLQQLPETLPPSLALHGAL